MYTKQNINMEHERKIADLQKRVTSLENLCFAAKEVLNLEEAAAFLGIKRSTLYKMTSLNQIPFYKPNGKLIFFEKSTILEWVRQNRSMSMDEIKEQASKVLEQLNAK